jgi:predicted Zn-dependent peptidase
MEDLNAASEADYKAFYKKFYVPNNAVLVVAGDIKPKQAEELVRKYFADIPKGEKIKRNKVVEPEMKLIEWSKKCQIGSQVVRTVNPLGYNIHFR